MKLERDVHGRVRVVLDGGGYLESQSVESNLLFSIYNELKEIRCGLIDIEKEKTNA